MAKTLKEEILETIDEILLDNKKALEIIAEERDQNLIVNKLCRMLQKKGAKMFKSVRETHPEGEVVWTAIQRGKGTKISLVQKPDKKYYVSYSIDAPISGSIGFEKLNNNLINFLKESI